MRQVDDYPMSAEAKAAAGPVASLIRRGYHKQAEIALAGLMLWALEQLEAGRWTPAQVDEVFTLLSAFCVEHYGGIPLSEPAQELLLEGELFHDDGTRFGADRARAEALAVQLLNDGALVPA